MIISSHFNKIRTVKPFIAYKIIRKPMCKIVCMKIISTCSFDRRTGILTIIIKELDLSVHTACHQFAIVTEASEFVVPTTRVDFWLTWCAVTELVEQSTVH